MTTAALAVRRNQNLTRNKLEFKTGPISVGFMLVALIILLALLYLNQVTKTSLFNYKISNLSAKQTDLESQKQKLEIEAARLQSLSEVRASANAAGMVKTDSVSFATPQ